MADQLVQQALQMLQEAGCMDLVHESALEHIHPTRKAASGVAVAVWVCSPPRDLRGWSGTKKDQEGKRVNAGTSDLFWQEEGVTQVNLVRLGDPQGEEKAWPQAASWIALQEEAGGWAP
ncbi:hypothetical protein NDU88_007760 [Pleurodeles waltl]|uniref:Uncharacterized protein n=1 Tax=Pleurodeles waltl TaxID=8319 RepID=A0AAV7PNI2_PLEWA|nr:hypothetical protein NDU88_007760 [Pleurodeles waltl]